MLKVEKCVRRHQQILAPTRASASSDGFKNVRSFLRKWNERTIQSFNGTWLIGAGVDRDELFGPGGTPHHPEACEIGGAAHHRTYLEMKALYKESPQPQAAIKVPKVQGKESKHFCCERVFRFKAPYQRHSLIIHRRHGVSGSKTKKKRKLASPRKKASGVHRPKQPNRIDSSDSESSASNPEQSGTDSGFESGADDIVRFKLKDMVRVWWATEDPPAWFVGRVDKIMPATIEIYYEPDDTASVHLLRTSIIELCEDGLEQMDDNDDSD